MLKFNVTINGKAYPCVETMGALLRFKEETGRELTELAKNPSDVAIYLWCCVRSGCKRDGIEFPLSLMEFADNIDEETVNAWFAVKQAEVQKKTAETAKN